MKLRTFKMYCYFSVYFNDISENRKLRLLINQNIKIVRTMLFEKVFLKGTLKNAIIKTELSFTLVRTNFGPPIKPFRHYAFLSVGNPDTPSRSPV
jgi:hypothetical protein